MLPFSEAQSSERRLVVGTASPMDPFVKDPAEENVGRLVGCGQDSWLPDGSA